jgi:hypothetical protein
LRGHGGEDFHCLRVLPRPIQGEPKLVSRLHRLRAIRRCPPRLIKRRYPRRRRHFSAMSPSISRIAAFGSLARGVNDLVGSLQPEHRSVAASKTSMAVRVIFRSLELIQGNGVAEPWMSQRTQWPRSTSSGPPRSSGATSGSVVRCPTRQVGSPLRTLDPAPGSSGRKAIAESAGPLSRWWWK